MLRALKQRILALGAVLTLFTIPVALLRPGLSPAWLVLGTVVALWASRLVRRSMAKLATRALSRGDSKRARRLYVFLGWTSLSSTARQACQLSLAACAASEGRYELALNKLARIESPLEGSLLAVSLNLRAYCLARDTQEFNRALALSEEAVSLRPQVPGFRHTRGLILLELSRWDEALRDLEATWTEGPGDPLLESERCFDLGRLWSARGQRDYASDYFERAFRAAPLSRWSEAAQPFLAVDAEAQDLQGLASLL